MDAQLKGSRSVQPDGRFCVTSFEPLVDPGSAPHTLIVGTMPSITSHGQATYYAHASNAFWWIAGEALGFRRGGPRGEAEWPDQFQTKVAKDILAGLNKTDAEILGYEEQVKVLLAYGYIMWDIVRSCSIRNSDDTSISDYVPNDIPGLLAQYPTIRRIVFSSGKTSAALFARMNRAWLRSRPFLTGRTEFSRAVFGRLVSADPSPSCPPVPAIDFPPVTNGAVGEKTDDSSCVSDKVGCLQTRNSPRLDLSADQQQRAGVSSLPVDTGALHLLEVSAGDQLAAQQSLQVPSLPNLEASSRHVGSWACSKNGAFDEAAAGLQPTVAGAWSGSSHLPAIELIVPLSVSPAGSASLRFPAKRDHWLEHVFNHQHCKRTF